MLRVINAFFRRNDAQDLVEYTLLLAFIGLVGISIVLGASGGIQGIWGTANTALVAANTSAAGSNPGSPPPPDPGGPGGGGNGHGGGGGDHDHDH
jgi:Flp pilus assembly pilin Flp